MTVSLCVSLNLFRCTLCTETSRLRSSSFPIPAQGSAALAVAIKYIYIYVCLGALSIFNSDGFMRNAWELWYMITTRHSQECPEA